MNIKLKIGFISSTLTYLFSKIPYALAAQNPPGIPPGNSGNGFNINSVFEPAKSGKISTIGDLATIALTVLTSLAGILSVFFIIFAGIKFITGAGDDKKMQNAKDTLTYAIIGLSVTALAFVILQIVQYLVGSKVGIT